MNHDKRLWLPVFDIDARHFTVTVYRPVFDEKGNRVSSEVGPKDAEVKVKTEEVGPKGAEVGPKSTEVKVKTEEVKAKTEEVKVKPNFEIVMKGYRRDLRETCARIWECLALNDELTQREIATQLQISESSVLSAMNALQEVGLLKREGYGKGRTWIVKSSVT